MSDLPSERPPSDGYGSQDEKFIPLADYEVLKEQFFEERERKLRALDERDQLKDALAKVGAGITKASDMVEGIIETRDDAMITNLAFILIRTKHPKRLAIRYKGSEWKEIYHE